LENKRVISRSFPVGTMDEISPESTFLKKSQVAKMFQVSERTIENWVSDGFLPAFRIGRSVRFNREAILNKIREQQK
jgi:excisionase family DNA binding protein